MVVLQKPYDLEALGRNIREAIDITRGRRGQVAQAS
jgi:hypothetical protein